MGVISYFEGKIRLEKKMNRVKLFKRIYQFWQDFYTTELGYLPTKEQLTAMTRKSIAQAIFDGKVDWMYRLRA